MAVATREVSLNEEFGRSFEQEWPEFARRLDRFLAAKGVDPWQRADVIQETATRLYRRWSKLDHSRPLWNLVVTIALRLLVDEHRRTSRLELVSDAPQAEVDDVETRALNRVQLARTRTALKKLRSEQRRVLLAEIGEAAALDGSRSRINVLRLRARAALKGELGPWAPAAIALRVRSLKASIERRLAELGRDAQALMSSAASVAMAATLVVAGAGIGDIDDRGDSIQEQRASLPLLSTEQIRGANLHPEVGSVGHPDPPNPSRAKERAKKNAAAVFGPVNETTRQANDAMRDAAERPKDVLEEANGDLREGNSQARRGEKKVRRVLTDPPLP